MHGLKGPSNVPEQIHTCHLVYERVSCTQARWPWSPRPDRPSPPPGKAWEEEADAGSSVLQLARGHCNSPGLLGRPCGLPASGLILDAEALLTPSSPRHPGLPSPHQS